MGAIAYLAYAEVTMQEQQRIAQFILTQALKVKKQVRQGALETTDEGYPLTPKNLLDFYGDPEE